MKKLIIIWALLISTVYAQSKPGFFVVGGKVITVQDTSSRKYLKAIENAGVVPSVLQNAASNFLVTSEKAIGSYSLMTAQYGFIGGTANTHSLNINNPNGLASGFTLAYEGAVAHSATGIQGNSSGSANTFINGTTLTPNSIHLSFYSRTNRSSTNQREIGFEINPYASPGNYAQLIIRRSDLAFSALGNDNTNIIVPNTDSRGYYIANRASSTSNNIVKNGVIIGSNTTSNTQTYPNANILLLAFNFTSTGTLQPTERSNLESGYISIGAGMTDAIALGQSRIVTFYNSMQNR